MSNVTPRRSWRQWIAGLPWMAWTSQFVVGLCLFVAQFDVLILLGTSSRWTINGPYSNYRWDYGWPFGSFGTHVFSDGVTTTQRQVVQIPSFFINLAILVAVLLAVGYLFRHGGSGSDGRWQISLRKLFAFVGMLSIAFALLRLDPVLEAWQDRFNGEWFEPGKYEVVLNWQPDDHALHAYWKWPVYLGFAAVVFAIGSVVGRVVTALLHRGRLRRGEQTPEEMLFASPKPARMRASLFIVAVFFAILLLSLAGLIMRAG